MPAGMTLAPSLCWWRDRQLCGRQHGLGLGFFSVSLLSSPLIYLHPHLPLPWFDWTVWFVGCAWFGFVDETLKHAAG